MTVVLTIVSGLIGGAIAEETTQSKVLTVEELKIVDKSNISTDQKLDNVRQISSLNTNVAEIKDKIDKNSSFMRKAFPVLSGSFAGAVLVFIVNWLLSWIKSRKQRNVLIQHLINALEGYKIRIGQLINELSSDHPNFSPLYLMDVLPFESTVFLQYELIKDIGLKIQLDTIRYESAHINRRLDILIHKLKVVQRMERDAILSLLQGHESKSSMLERIEDALKLLKKERQSWWSRIFIKGNQ